MASSRNGKRRGPAATVTSEGVAAGLAAALEMERTGSSELHPPTALMNDEPNDAQPTKNGSFSRAEAPMGGKDDDGAAIVSNGADTSNPNALVPHCPGRA